MCGGGGGGVAYMQIWGKPMFHNGSSDWSNYNAFQRKQLVAAKRQHCGKSSMGMGCQPRIVNIRGGLLRILR